MVYFRCGNSVFSFREILGRRGSHQVLVDGTVVVPGAVPGRLSGPLGTRHCRVLRDEEW